MEIREALSTGNEHDIKSEILQNCGIEKAE